MSLWGCGFEPGGIPPVNIPEDCLPACLDDDTLLSCDPAAPQVVCALGCDADAAACFALIPSNGVSFDLFVEPVEALAIPDGAVAELSTDDGRLVIDGQEVRGPGEDVVAGIGFAVAEGDLGVLAVASLDLGVDARLVISGSRPVALLSAGDMTLRGVIDASAGADGNPRTAGPGGGNGAVNDSANALGCAPGSAGDGVLGLGDETGGGGGAFGSDGGDGGNGNRSGGDGGKLADGTCPGVEMVPLEGGSGGGAGGINGNGGEGGGGGGGVQISALTRIVVESTGEVPAGIDAGGGGGGGGKSNDGGGGGGAGGGILLEAPEIVLNGAIVAANGGGGGGQDGTDGAFGEDAATGGGGDRTGGAGGARGVSPTDGQGGGDNTGGGGGGVGIIRINVPDANLDLRGGAQISPDPTRADPATN